MINMTTIAMRFTCGLGSCVDFLAEESVNVLCDRSLESDHFDVEGCQSDDDGSSSSTEPSHSMEWIDRETLSDLWEGIGLEEKHHFVSDLAAESRDEENDDDVNDDNSGSSLLEYESFPSRPDSMFEQVSLLSASLAPLVKRQRHRKNENRTDGKSEKAMVMSTTQERLEHSRRHEQYKNRSDDRSQEKSMPSASQELQAHSRGHTKNKKEKEKKQRRKTIRKMSDDELSEVFHQLENVQQERNSRRYNRDALEQVPIAPNSILKKTIVIIGQQDHDTRRCLQ
jgi:hypothetical protein